MQRVLLVGCGDIALRVADRLRHRVHMVGLIRDRDDVAKLRAHGVIPLIGDLDQRRSLARLQTAPFAVLHFAPPPGEGRNDPRTRHLLVALASARIIPRHIVYISTTGVYGDCNGECVSETRPRRATTPRAQRRVDAEQRLRRFAAQHGIALSILRVPGIYASTRLPLPRLRQGTPALVDEHDVYTNHVHADDLARAAIAALYRGRPNRAYNVSDDSELKMGEWFDLVADAFRLPRAPRVTRDVAQRTVTPALLSFMNESRRLSNRRMKRELRVSLTYPTPHTALAQAAPRALTKQLALPIGDKPTQPRNHAR